MKNKGFTLIELLAVIVILAVIGIIAVPIILNVIETSKKGAIKDSAYGIIDSANVYVASNLKNGLKNNIKFTCEKNKCVSEKGEAINYKGKVEHGTLIIDTKSNVLVCVDDGEYYALKNVNDQEVTTGEGTCGAYEEENGKFVVEDDFETLKRQYEAEIKTLSDKVNFIEKLFEEGFIVVSWGFDYSSEGEQAFPVEIDGTYKLEVWGAQGGTGLSVAGGYGGYSVGQIKLKKGQVLFVNVGGAGTSVNRTANSLIQNGGYNGGGGGNNALCNHADAGGGGATHIALSSGEITSFANSDKTGPDESKKDDILIVAGGGGGGHGHGTSKYNTPGGAGGGFKGIGGTDENSYFEFGQGYQNLTASGNVCGGAGGGGGYYGGIPGGNNITYAGGTGYIGNTNLTNKKMAVYCTGNCTSYTTTDENKYTEATSAVSLTAESMKAKSGNGYAKITLLSMD